VTDAVFAERLVCIREAFWALDPIGVAAYRPGNDDEYDQYIGRYLRRRADGASVDAAARDAAALLRRLTELDDVDPDRLFALLEEADRP